MIALQIRMRNEEIEEDKKREEEKKTSRANSIPSSPGNLIILFTRSLVCGCLSICGCACVSSHIVLCACESASGIDVCMSYAADMCSIFQNFVLTLLPSFCPVTQSSNSSTSSSSASSPSQSRTVTHEIPSSYPPATRPSQQQRLQQQQQQLQAQRAQQQRSRTQQQQQQTRTQQPGARRRQQEEEIFMGMGGVGREEDELEQLMLMEAIRLSLETSHQGIHNS